MARSLPFAFVLVEPTARYSITSGAEKLVAERIEGGKPYLSNFAATSTNSGASSCKLLCFRSVKSSVFVLPGGRAFNATLTASVRSFTAR